jgi:uncharacterized protein (DUF433 family)
MTVTTTYVQARDGNLYVGSSRVTLDSVIVPWQAGQTPEAIHADFPTIPLSDIYGAIAYYLEHRAELDAWLRECDELYERERAAQQAADPAFYANMRQRMAEARARLGEDEPGSAP